MSLAALLKADLEDLDDDEQEEYENDEQNNQVSFKDEKYEIEDVGMAEEEAEYKATIDSKAQFTKESVRNIAKLLDSQQLKEIVKKIETYQTSGSASRGEIIGPVEEDPEYKLIVEANNLTVEIDNEINVIHKYIRDKYLKRFPELESLVPDALDYIKTVRELGNNVSRAKNNEVLQKFLTTATIMVVSVSASTTQGESVEKINLRAF
jgi:U4/U6 small nuclear ribonucleoprotein PRP31